MLVVYFSASGNTERVAGYIAEATGGTLFELVPVTPYTAADLSYNTAGSRVNREHDDESLRDIALEATTPDNFGDYDVVFVGYPIWWSVSNVNRISNNCVRNSNRIVSLFAKFLINFDNNDNIQHKQCIVIHFM